MNKKFFSLMAAFLFAVAANAQVEDIYGVRVTQSGDVYKATYNKKTDNGGSASETWTGRIVNGKREGVWKFTANYSKFMYAENNFRSGSITMTRTYKNGLPNGTYSINQNITEQIGSYNAFIGEWVYKTPENRRETVTGSFVNGMPDGTWNVKSERSDEIITMKFIQGKPDGVWTHQKYQKDQVTFKNGYVIHQKQYMDNGLWGYELKYPNDDPTALQLQDTVFVNDYLAGFNYYAYGMFVESYIKDYPKGASNDEMKPYYILAAYKEYNKLWGNVPEYELGAYQRELERAEQERGLIPLFNKANELTPRIKELIDRFKNENHSDYRGYRKMYEFAKEMEKIDSICPDLKDLKDPFKYQKHIEDPVVISDYVSYYFNSRGYEQSYKEHIARRAEEMQFAKIGIPEEQYAYFIDNFDERRLKDTLKIIRNNTFRMKNQALKNEPLPLADYVNIALFVSPLNTEGRDLVQKRYCIPTEEEAREIINALIDVVIEQDIERGQVYDVFGNYRKTSYDSRNIPSYFEMMGIQDKYKLTEQAQFPNIPKIQKEVSKKYPNLK